MNEDSRSGAVASSAPALPDDEIAAAETSGATTSLIIAHVRSRGGDDAVERLLASAGVPYTAAELERRSRWVDYRTRIRLFTAAVEVLGDPDCTRQMGATSIRSGLPHALVLLVRALGSPAQVYRQLPRSVPKFTTTSTMEVVQSGRTYATLRYRLHEEYEHSRLDCLYAQGLISVVPEIFDLPPAVLVHEECQSDGFEACVYQVRWERRRLLRRRRRDRQNDRELVALRGQLSELQSAAADLVSTEDLMVLLGRIVDRAAGAVLAPAYVLALHDPHGGEPLVHTRGLSPARERQVVDLLLQGHDPGEEAVVVDVSSSRREHGKLAALYPRGQRGPTDEREMLQAYAGHAAAALDLLAALDQSRRGESRSTALLSLADSLQSAQDAAAVGQVVVEALPTVVGCDTATLYRWDEHDGLLRAVASTGLTDAEVELVGRVIFEPESSPELGVMLTRLKPTVLCAEATTPAISALISRLHLSDVIAMPLVAGGELVGVATAGWRIGNPLTAPEESLARLQGVAHYAATAMQNAVLLATVRHQSLHDHLTGLPNRALFAETVQSTTEACAHSGSVALLFCDLDRFKQVNDVLGHAAGDELLRQVADRLRAAVRPGDLVARLSGDEFAVLLVDSPSAATAGTVAERVVEHLARPFHIEGLDLRVTTSVGVALHHDGATVEMLLNSADEAMYAAKQQGRNQVGYAHEEAGRPGRRREGSPRFEAELRAAVGAGQLRLHFQPIVRLDPTGRSSAPAPVAGVEALLRWQHPELGLLGPAAFLPLAEETDLVADLDLWTVAEACRLLASWPTSPDRPHYVTVNASARTVADPRLRSAIRQALTAHGLDPSQLWVEVVESRSLIDLPGVVDRLSAIRRMGVRIALDDFGTGYSTLAWLQQLPVDALKLDRSFTATLVPGCKSQALAEGVLALAGRMGLDVVAEGVETAEQAAILRAAGFTLGQGYLWGKPAPPPPSCHAGATPALPAPPPHRC